VTSVATVPRTVVSSDRCRFTVDGVVIDFLWGRSDSPGTASFWVSQTLHRGFDRKVAAEGSAVGLREQMIYCLLGGYGVRAETACAVFESVRSRVDLSGSPTAGDLEAALLEPVLLPSGRLVRYRFWRQRARRIAEALRYFDAGLPPTEPLALRQWLLEVGGIGPKTASWVVRNSTGSDDVAIIDIWLLRVLRGSGVFPVEWTAERDYWRLETVFLEYARAGGVAPSALDWCIWELGRAILPALSEPPR
jgi:N-glycosylase/DNA lyase